MRKGQKHSEETQRRMKENHWSKHGGHTWNRGLTMEMDNRIKNNGLEHLSEEHKQRLRENHWSKKEGYIHPMLGKHHTEKAKKAISLRQFGKSQSKETILKRSLRLKGKHTSFRTEFKKGQMALEKHYNWQGGKSFEPYAPEFNNKLKEQIRDRDSKRCQQCFRHQDELRRKLTVHHIDFNKQNNNPINLISLCPNCHSQTNFGREGWINYFQDAITSRGIK